MGVIEVGLPVRTRTDRREAEAPAGAAAELRRRPTGHIERSVSESVFTTESTDWMVPSTVGFPQRT